jgi:geranylgeranyl diphosphate synthase, type I
MTKQAGFAKENLLKFKPRVEEVINKVFASELEVTKEFTPDAIEYITELKNVTLVGGKRLRGAFVYYSYLMNGGTDLEAILKISAAIEILHAFLLVEDDFMDIAATRRGYPTIHNTYANKHKDLHYKKDSSHFGNAVAVNVGIIGDHLALNTINNSDFPLELRQKAQTRINRQIITTGHGQIHDILNEARSDLTEEDILNVLYWKTGIYTYDNPIHVGAIFAGVNGLHLTDLSKYAIPGGVAFQIQDDILGSFGDSGKTGKPDDSDIKEGKQTLLTFKAYEKANKAQKEVLDNVLGNHKASDSDIEEVRKIFINTGALQYSKDKALELVTSAKQALFDSKKDFWVQEGMDFLIGIADYMIDRDL